MAPTGWFSRLDLQRGPILDFCLSVRISFGAWFPIIFSFDSLIHHKEPGIAAISLYRGKGIVSGDLRIVKSISIKACWILV